MNLTSTQKKTPIHSHTASEITDLNNVLSDYQEVIEDLWTIRSNASAGKSASDTIATYGDVVTHDADEFAAASHSHAIADVTGLETALNWKQDTLIAGSNIQIAADGKTISATDTTYNVLSDSDLETGTSTVSKVVTAKVIADYVKGKIASAVVYQGQVDDYDSLPANPVKWDMYNVVAAHSTAPTFDAGTNVVWNGETWDPMAEMIDLSDFYTKTEINAMSGLNSASAGFSAVDIAVDSSTKQASATDHTDDQSMNAAQDRNIAAIKAIMNAYNALETRVDTAESNISAVYTKSEINTITGLNAASAGFVSNTIAEWSDGKVTATVADNVSIATAETNNKSAIAALATAHNNVIDRLESLEEGDDEKTKFFQVTFAGTSHTYSNDFFKVDTFINYNFASDPAGYVTFEMSAGKLKIESTATESNLVIKIQATNNPGTFTSLTAD